MIWYDHMFLGKKCHAKANRLKYKISNRLAHQGVFLIVLPQSEHAVLEIIPSVLLLQKNYPAEDLKIVGMASTRNEALSLLEYIIGEMYRTQGNFDVSAFMQQYR